MRKTNRLRQRDRKERVEDKVRRGKSRKEREQKTENIASFRTFGRFIAGYSLMRKKNIVARGP